PCCRSADRCAIKGVSTLSIHRKSKSGGPRMSAREYVATGVTGAAMVGIGLLLAAPPGAPAPVIADVQLVNTERMLPLGPQDCLLTAEGCGGGGLFGSGGSVMATPTALAAAIQNPFPPLFGPGGFLIGDGLDAAADCEGDACN